MFVKSAALFMSGTGRKTRRTTIEVNDRIALETAQAGPVPHDSIAAIMKDRANPDIEIVSKPIIQELSLARILSGVAEFNYEKNMRDTIDKDDIHSSGSFNQSQAGAGPTQADAETSRFRPRKPVQYMPVARSSRAPQLLMGQKSDDAYLADIPAVLSEEERRADEARYLLDKSDMLVDASLSESDLARYLTRVQAKVIISRINPPAANAVLLGDSTDISTGEGSTSEEDFLPTAAETDSVSAAKRQPPPTAGADRKRTRLTRSKAFLEEPPEQLCDSNSGIIFVDGALVLMHPNIHEFFVLVLKKW